MLRKRRQWNFSSRTLAVKSCPSHCTKQMPSHKLTSQNRLIFAFVIYPQHISNSLQVRPNSLQDVWCKNIKYKHGNYYQLIYVRKFLQKQLTSSDMCSERSFQVRFRISLPPTLMQSITYATKYTISNPRWETIKDIFPYDHFMLAFQVWISQKSKVYSKETSTFEALVLYLHAL